MRNGFGVLCGGLLLAGAALAGCGTTSDQDTGGGDASRGRLTGVRWVPETVTVDGREHVLPSGVDAHVEFRPGATAGEGGKSGGSVGCNDIGADVSVRGDTIEVSEVARTLMRCPGDRMRFEKHFLEVFHGQLAVGFSDGGDTLVLTGENGDTLTLEAEPGGKPE